MEHYSNHFAHHDHYQSHNVTLPDRAGQPLPPLPAEMEQPKVSALARRIHGWTWQAFPIGMGTGAVYVTLSGLKEHSTTLTNVETFFYFLNMALFLLNVTTLLIQLIVYPKQSLRLIKDPVKGIFVPLVVLSFATIIIGTIKYAVPTGHVQPGFIYALFWVYVVFAVLVCFPMLMVWFNKPHDLTTFTPAWAFLIFPMMLVGVVAFNVLDVIPASEERAIGVLLTGYVFQGLGFFMTFFYICIYIIRIMTTGFLDGHQANGAFVAVGPPGFTALALIKLGQKAMEILPMHGLVSKSAGEIWYATSVMSGLMLFGLAVFLFFFGLLPYWFKLHKHLHEILGCWALTFPNVGWISTVRVLGDIFGLRGFFTWHLIMAILMCAVWLILFGLTAWAFARGKIFMATPEDVLHDSLDLHHLPHHLPHHHEHHHDHHHEHKGAHGAGAGSPPSSGRSSFVITHTAAAREQEEEEREKAAHAHAQV